MNSYCALSIVEKEVFKHEENITLSLLVVATSTMFFVSHCGKKNPYEGKPASEAEKQIQQDKKTILLDSNLSNKQKAEHLTAMGKQVVESPSVAHLALMLFDDALAFDDQNIKANFYSAALSPIFTLRGIPHRFSGFIKHQKDIDEFVKENRPKDVKSEVEAFVDYMYAKQEKSSEFKKISDIQNFIVFDVLREMDHSLLKLQIVENQRDFQDTFSYKYWSNKFTLKHSVNFDQAEVHSLKVVYKALSMLLKTASSYQLDNALDIHEAYKNKKGIMFKTIVQASMKYPHFLTLRSNGRSLLQSIVTDSSDIIEGLRIIAGILKSDGARYNLGFLLPSIDEKSYEEIIAGLDNVATYLAGPVAVKMGKINEEVISLNINSTTLFANPLRDLRSIFPTQFTQDGRKGTLFPDLTFGGVIPHSDLVSKYCELKKSENEPEVYVDLPRIHFNGFDLLGKIGCSE